MLNDTRRYTIGIDSACDKDGVRHASEDNTCRFLGALHASENWWATKIIPFYSPLVTDTVVADDHVS